MAQQRPNCVGLALVLLFVFQSAYAIDKCKAGCDGPSGPFKFTPGTTYKYDYDGKINILVSTAEGEQTSTEVKATVLLTQQADCTQVLRLQNVQIVGPDGKKRSGLQSIEKPVVLNSNNGALNDFICTEPGENQNSLNLKRAVASLFQANLEKSTEIDVFGQCPTYVSKTVEGDITTITKNKNLNKCAFRETITNDYLTSTFDIHSDIQSSPVLNSNLDSKQKIKAGVLDSANVVENYLFVPFSVGQNGAKATIESKLTLTGTSKDTPSTKCSVPKSIIFENPHPVTSAKSNMNTILKHVKAISDNLGAVVEDQVAIEFIGLVKLLRVSKKPDILSVYNQIRSGSGFADKEAVKKIFLDAVLTAGTGDTIEVAIELLKNKELSPMEEKQLFGGLPRARHVTENSIKTATDLLNRANLPKEAYLGVGALAGRYCAQHECDKVDAINKIIQKLLSKLGDLKAANRKEENVMIFVMKGLTNVGFLNDAILSKIVSLAEDKKQPIRLRVSTLEAYQAAPCKDKLRDSALKVLKDTQQDSEIRIKAYLVLSHCPNEKIGKAVKALLETEKSHQVGGYISSHIKNLRASTNPDKLLAKTHLGFVHTPNRFPFDPRKYSFNGEFSYSVDAIGMADNIEGSVIYSQNSYLPRSTNLNLTSEIFGHRFNFLELVARQENLDKVIEHYLGPQGILRKATLQQNYDNLAKPFASLLKNLKEKVDKSLRARRDVSKADIEAINKKIQIKSNELDKNLDLDLSIKTFGNEIIFMNSFDITEKMSPQGIIDGLINKLNDGLDNLKSFEKTLRLNLLFLDAELSYPTSLGFPLRLGVDGAANIQVKTSGNIDVRDLIAQTPANDINLKISIIPSASVSIVGRFTFDTPLIENGLKVSSTLHTSTGGEIEVKTFNQGFGLDVKFNVPVQKQEIIGLKHKILYQTKENGVATNKFIRFSQNKDFSICVDQLAQFIGLEFCADVNGPNLSGKKVPILPFPLSGNAMVSVRIERGDINTIHYRREIISKKGTLGVEANLETLRKNNEKAAGLKVEAYYNPETYIKASLTSPIKNAVAEARLVFNDKEKILALSVKDENKVLYSAKAGLQVDSGADKTVYHPILQYTTPQNQAPQTPPFHAEGKVIAVKNANDIKYTFDDLTLIIPNRKNIVFSGNMGTEGPAYFSDVTISDGTISGSLAGRLEAHPDQVKVQAQVKNSLKPSLNFDIRGDFKKQKNPDLISSNIQFTHGEDLQSKTKVITLTNSLTMKNPKDPKTLELTTKNRITYPLAKLGGKFDLEKSPKSLHYDTFVQYGELKLGSELKFKVNAKSVGDYQLELDVYDIKNRVELKSSRQVVGPDDSKISNSIGLNNKKIEVNGKVKHRVKPADVNIAADLTVKVPSQKTPLKVNGLVKVNPRELDTHLKILSGKTPLIDTSLKGNRGGDANGHIKMNLKDTLTVDGQLTSKKGVGKANAVIDFKSLKKTTKLDSSFTIQRPKFNLLVNLYPVFNEDPKKKISLNTNNEITGNTVHSKTNLDFLGHKYAVNANAQLSNLLNGKTTADVELTVPGPLYLSGKLTRDATTKDGNVNSNTEIILGQSKDKATPGRKLIIKAVAKDTNIKEGVVDITVNVAADNSAGKNANLDLSLKRQKNGDEIILNFNNKITSSLLSSPIETNYNAQYSKSGGNFNLKASVDPKASLHLEGKFTGDTSAARKTGFASVDLALPSQTLSNVKSSVAVVLEPLGTKQGIVDLSGRLQTTSNVPNLNIDTSGNLKVQGSKNSGKISFHQELKKPTTLSIHGSGGLNVDTEKKTGKANGNLKIVLPNKKVIEGSGTFTRVSPKEYNLEASLDLPTKTHKSNKLTVHTKRSDDNDISSQATLDSDGQKHTLNTELSLNPREPKIDLQMTCPMGKLSQISANLKRPSNDRIMGNIKVLSQSKDFLLEGGLDVNTESSENLYIQLTGNCPKLNINDVVFKIGGNNNPDKNTVNVLLTSAGKNVISGDAKITNRQEQGKNIVEGSGDFKVGTEKKSGNFKYIRTILTSEKNGENGNEISFDATIGTKAIDAELKITDKEFRYMYSFCEASKQCAHVEIDAKTTTNEVARYDGQLEVTIDLRVLGLPTEFGLKSVTHRDNLLLDHTVDIHFENAANKYKYTLSIHPSQFEISLTTPNRIISLEGTATLPGANLQNGGKASGEIAFYTDKKNNPNTKSSLTGTVNVDIQRRTVDAEGKLNIVNMNRPLVIKYTKTVPKPDLITSGSQKLIVDIFASPDQKIVATQTHSAQYDKNTHKAQGQNAIIVKSTGLGVDIAMNLAAVLEPKALTGSFKASSNVGLSQNKYENILKLSASPKEANLLVKALNNVILEILSTIAIEKGQIDVNSQVTGLGFEPIEADLQIKNYNSVTLTRFIKSDPSNKLVVKAAVIPGQTAEVGIDQQTGGTSKSLVLMSVDLGKKNFLKPTFNVEGEQLKELSSKIRTIAANQVKETATKIKENVEKLSSDGSALLDKAKNSIPDATQSVQFYQKEAEAFKQELDADKTLHNLGQLLENIINTVFSVVGKVVSDASNILGRAVQAISNAVSDVASHIKTALLPRLQAFAQAIVETAMKMADKVEDIIANLVVKAGEILKAIEPQLAVIASTVCDVMQDIVEAISSVLENIRHTIIQQVKHIEEQLKKSAIVSELKAQYHDLIKNGLPSQDVLVNTMRSTFGMIRELIPLPEVQQLIDQISQYLEKVVTNQPVDDVAEIRKIGGTAINLVSKLVGAIAKEIVPDILKGLKIPSINLDLLRRLPSLGSIRISALNYLLQEDLTPFARFLLRAAVNPKDFIMFSELSSIVALSEVFTFDGKIYYLPADNCNYLLAGDAVNGNFSIVGNFKNKIFSAITLDDRSGTITLTSDKKLLLDNVEVEVPVQKDTLRVYRTKGYYYIESKTGVQVVCEVNFLGCDIIISGFYRGQLRGLLGNGNNEPYDDGTLPTGKIVDKLSEIANTYAVGPQCAPIQVKEIIEPKSDPKCEKMFDYESPLRLCYPFVDRKIAKKACDYGAAQGDKDIHRMTGSLYAYECYKSNIPVEIPLDLSEQCSNSITPRKVDEQFNIALPGKSADVLLLVSTDKSNEVLYTEYGQTLVTAIVNEYKAKGIDDVVFHSIAYGGANQKPSFVTVGGDISFKDKAPTFTFKDSPKPQKLVTGITDVDRVIGFIRTILHDLKTVLGLTLESETYADAINYPFRVEAVRTIVGITSDPCEHGLLIPLQVAKATLMNRRDINMNLITPTKDFKVKDAATTKGIIGFNSENVITLSEAASKPTGSPALQKFLTFNDLCSDHTVGLGGNVFVSDNLLANKDKKDQIVQAIAKNIVNSSTSKKVQLECTCGYTHSTPTNPYSHCKPVDIKEA